MARFAMRRDVRMSGRAMTLNRRRGSGSVSALTVDARSMSMICAARSPSFVSAGASRMSVQHSTIPRLTTIRGNYMDATDVLIMLNARRGERSWKQFAADIGVRPDHLAHI